MNERIIGFPISPDNYDVFKTSDKKHLLFVVAECEGEDEKEYYSVLSYPQSFTIELKAENHTPSDMDNLLSPSFELPDDVKEYLSDHADTYSFYRYITIKPDRMLITNGDNVVLASPDGIIDKLEDDTSSYQIGDCDSGFYTFGNGDVLFYHAGDVSSYVLVSSSAIVSKMPISRETSDECPRDNCFCAECFAEYASFYECMGDSESSVKSQEYIDRLCAYVIENY